MPWRKRRVMVHCAALFFGGSATNGGCGGRGARGSIRAELRAAAPGRIAAPSRCRPARRGRSRTRCSASSFPTAETGFDPGRVSDLYSNTVTEAIFERLLTYDYLARPAKLVPDGRPKRCRTVADDGRTYTFSSARASTSRPTRRSRASGASSSPTTSSIRSSASSIPKNRSPWAFMIEGKIEGLDELAERGEEDGQVRLRRPGPGPAGASTAIRCASASSRPTTTSCTSMAHVAVRRDRARSRRGVRRRPDGASGRHRAVRAEGMARASQDRPRGQSRLSRFTWDFAAVGPEPGTTRSSRR